MGIISELAAQGAASFTKSAPVSRPTQGAPKSRATWQQIFRSSNKEERLLQQQPPENPGWGRSMVSTNNATKRLIEALRSMAPGGWSDDRWGETQHLLGITYVAIHRQCELLTQSEFEVFVKDRTHPDGKRPIRPEDPVMGDRYGIKPWDLVQLLEHPNKQDDWGDLVSRWNQQMDLTGTALTWLVPNRLGTPYELYPIPTALAIPQPAVNPDFPDGYYRIQPVYPYGPFSSYPTPAAAVGAAVPAQWMMRFQYPHPFLRYDGYSPLTALRSHIDQHESMDRARFYSMKRGINPSAVLQFDEMEGAQPLPWSEIERIKAEFENEMYGTENWSKLFVTTPGAKLEPFGTRPIDMDFQAGWEQVASFILGGGFGITKPAAGMSESSSYANLFASLKQLYWQTLDPKCSRYGRKLTKHLAPFFGDDLIIEVRCKRIDDHEILFQKIDKAMQAKAVTKNGVLKLLDLPVTSEEWGDDIAGDPTPAEKEQQEQQMDGAMGGGMPGMGAAPPEQPPTEEVVSEEEESGEPSLAQLLQAGSPEDEKLEREADNPGRMDRNSLGSRKRLEEYNQKHLGQNLEKVFANGYHQ